MKKYVNKAGNVVIIEQEKDGFSPMYENYTFLNYFTWEDKFPPLQDSEFESIEEWFNSVSKYDFSELKKAYFENNKAGEIGFYELLCEKLSEEDIFALPIMKVKGATYPYAIVNSPCTLEGDMVGIAWNKKESISERLGVEIAELSNATKTILEKVALDLKLQNLYLNGEVYQFTLYKDDSLKEELMNIGGLINYDSDEELFEAILSHISDKVEDLDFERVYEPAVISKEYVERYINNDGDTLLLVNDECPLNPMEDWDTLMNYYTWENRYISMQKGANQFSDEEDWYDSVMGEGAYLRQAQKSKENNRSVVGFAYDLCANLDKKGIYALPILKYEHSLVRYYIGDSVDRWEGGVVGFAWRDKKELCKEYGVKKLSQKLKTETIEKVVESELKAYTSFANGESYGFELYSREDGEDVIDSCYGFIGYDSTEELFKDILEEIPDGYKDFFKVD